MTRKKRPSDQRPSALGRERKARWGALPSTPRVSANGANVTAPIPNALGRDNPMEYRDNIVRAGVNGFRS